MNSYKGWKGNAEEIARELEANKAIGLRFGTWKAGVLVSDDAGQVDEAIKEWEKERLEKYGK